MCVVYEVDFFELDLFLNNKKVVGILVVLLFMIFVVGGVVFLFVNN